VPKQLGFSAVLSSVWVPENSAPPDSVSWLTVVNVSVPLEPVI
jgi:hypothetical protein